MVSHKVATDHCTFIVNMVLSWVESLHMKGYYYSPQEGKHMMVDHKFATNPALYFSSTKKPTACA